MKAKSFLYQTTIHFFNYIPNWVKIPVFSIFRKLKFFRKNRRYQDLTFSQKFSVSIKAEDKKFKLNNWGKDSTLENSIFWTGLEFGDWEPETIPIWIKLCKNAKVVFDVGANTGVYSLVAKAVNPNITVIAFEPSDLVIGKFKANMKLNNFDVTLEEKGVSNSTGKKIFYDVEGEHQTSASLDPDKLKNFKNFVGKIREYKIDTIRTDDFIIQSGLRPDVIKIDVELHEPEVLEGMGDFLKDCSAAIIIEVLTKEVAYKLNDILKESKFQFYSLEKDRVELVTELTPKNNIYNYLLLPEGKFINEVV